jgi:outer membrane protein assembly factor BamB
MILSGVVAAACGGDSGSSPTPAPTPAPSETLTTLAPDTAVAGSSDLIITATGTGYTTSSVLNWNGTALTTHYVSTSSLTATIPASDLTSPGTSSVTVTDSSNGDVGSAVVKFTVTDQAAPSIASLAPSTLTAGGTGFQLTVTGTNFSPVAKVLWDGAPIPTTYDSATQLTAQVTAAQIAVPKSIAVTVLDDAADGGTSNVSSFVVTSTPPLQAAPTISSLSPSTVVAGGTGFQLTVTGTNFVPIAQVQWNGAFIPTTYDSQTQLTALVTAAQIAVPASIGVTVLNNAAAGGTSNVSSFTVTTAAPAPILTAVSPASVAAYSTGALTLTGKNFTASSVVLLNGSVVSATYVSSTQIAVGPVAFTYGSGSALQVTVEDPASGNVPSNAETIGVTPPVPVATSLAPASVIAAQGASSLTVSGQYFTSTSTVYLNGGALVTSLNNQGQLVAQLTAQDVAVAGTARITIEDPASSNVPSNALNLVIQALPPVSLTSLSPSKVPSGNGAFTLTVFGTGFSTSSSIALNGTALTTTYVSATTLSATVSAAAVANIGSTPVTVVNPGNQGGTSSPLTLTIVAPSIDAVSYQITNGHSGFVAFNSVTLPTSASWSVNVGGEPSYALIVGNVVYVTASVNGNSQLYALSGSTGATVWGPIAFAGVTGITYDAGTIFVDSGTYSTTGILSALNATTGNAIWSTTIPGQFATQSPPVAAEGLVYTLDDGTLTAFNESNGAQVWQQNVSGTNGAPAVTVDGVYAAPVCYAYDLQPATGAVIWSNNTGCEGGGGNTPVVGSGRMYAPLSPGYYAGNVYSAESGQVLSAFSASAPPALSTSSAFVLDNSTLQGIALSNNQILWSFAGDGTLVTAPVAVNNYVFVGSSSGNLYALDATTGAQVWTKNLGAAIAGPATGGNATQGATGLSAGDGLLIVPAGNTVNAFVLSANP